MTEVPPISSRKSDHIRINLEENVHSGLTTGLDDYQFIHQALPELDLVSVDTSTTIFNKRLNLPLLISSMTGGTPQASRINRILAEAAQHTGVAMGVGSQRAGIIHPELVESFNLRKFAPDILLFANLGAVQLNYGFSVDHCRQAVDMITADALILHLNPLQEALQPEGDTNFTGLLKKIEMVCSSLSVPIIIKEVGWGISSQTARMLASAGVAAIDVAGAGGTSWSEVEKFRTNNEHARHIAEAFKDWGIPTAESIQQVVKTDPKFLVFASGGLRNGIDLAKCIALGASLGGMAGLFLKSATKENVGVTIDTIQEIEAEIKICMFVAGAANMDQLKKTPLVKVR
jgi:isopentenyl-diphosphate delta-isomerase